MDILANKQFTLCHTPFIHFQTENALPEVEYHALENCMPVFSQLKGPPGCDRVNIDCEHLNGPWKLFVKQNSTASTFNRLAALFNYPLRIHDQDISLRSDPRNTPYKCCIQIGMNGINIKNTTEKIMQCHVDKPNKIFVLLLYMRHNKDTTPGGHLNLHSSLDSEPEVECKYDKNKIIAFLNHKSAFHSVTHRPRNLYPRRFINIVFESNPNLSPE